MAKLITPHILHDQALDPDRVPDKAAFNFEAYANTFTRLIAEKKTLTPLVLGISGQWGSGKTTLLKQIQTKLEETGRREQNAIYSFLGDNNEGDFRQCRTVWFNAWKYADEDELLVALVRVMVQAMADDDAVSKVLGQLLDPTYPRRDVVNTVLGWFALKTPVGEVKLNTGTPKETPFAEKTALLDLFSEAFDNLMAAWVHRKADVKKIDPAQGVLVVFVDDLDRCLPDKAVQVLEAIKLFLDRPGVVFVLAADEKAVQDAIEAHYQKQHIEGQRASDYLEKIFQVRFPLPPISAEEASKYFLNGLPEADAQLRQSLDVVLAGAEINPRQIKTFINYLNVGWAVLSNSGQARGVEQADFIRWLALTRVGAKFCEKVRDVPPDLRLAFIADAAKWANDPTHKPGEYQEWAGADYRRLRNVLKLTTFSPAVTAEVLNGFIFWSAPEVIKASADSGKVTETATVEKRIITGQADVSTEANLQAKGTVDSLWVTIPAGKFVMGSKDDNRDAQDNERPQHTVDIPYDYRIARYPVTNAEFKEFAQATNLKWTTDKPDNHPAVNVDWRMAVEYCRWRTQQERAAGTLSAREEIRLPSEAEWEKAARGEYGKEYPWGDEWEASRCNSDESGIGETTPVGQFSPQGDSPYGVADMAGNVWEWCRSKYKPYPYQANDRRETIDDSEDARVLRGGSFNYIRGLARCAFRNSSRPDLRLNLIGFRVCVVSPGSRTSRSVSDP